MDQDNQVMTLEEASRYLGPSTSLTVELKLQQKWERSALDRMRGHLGALTLDIKYEGELVHDVLVPI